MEILLRLVVTATYMEIVSWQPVQKLHVWIPPVSIPKFEPFRTHTINMCLVVQLEGLSLCEVPHQSCVFSIIPALDNSVCPEPLTKHPHGVILTPCLL